MFNKEIYTNIYFRIPECCYLNYEHTQWHEKVIDAFQWIQKTESGNALLKKIKNSSHQVILTTHLITSTTKSCNELASRITTRPDDFETAKTPGKGSSATIFLVPTKIDSLYFTTIQHDYHCFPKKPTCFESNSECLKKVPVVQILFHELIHAMHSVLGERDETRSFINKNREEQITIAAENQFLEELAKVPDIPKDWDLSPRVYHTQFHLHNDGVQEILKNQLSEEQCFFLLKTCPQILKSIPELCPIKKQEQKIPQNFSDDEDLYK